MKNNPLDSKNLAKLFESYHKILHGVDLVYLYLEVQKTWKKKIPDSKNQKEKGWQVFQLVRSLKNIYWPESTKLLWPEWSLLT